MNKKGIIGIIIVLIIIVVGGLLVFGSSTTNNTLTVAYNGIQVTTPGSFVLDDESGNLITSADGSYIVKLSDIMGDPKDEVDNWDLLKSKDVSKAMGVTGAKVFTVNKTKFLEVSSTDATFIKNYVGVDCKKVRMMEVILPGAKEIHGLYFVTNDTSLDLNTPEIEAIINSTCAAQE